ncbi:hypothetical protein A1O3_04450 [Capronia epimyces CBS 606.96]|uniref:Protein kinase domain-containing protein n=1 Tax=Capronia epimyces CBS 606.96 TaxID=1182542 RepID=W9YCV2_9EURO|nr:uncharacterized protein A1O3_04450 [Capronia epimyces CBS 606.96]EXJ87490.1 hypothetical protein A1O3_04450 [Capronia epimyces CBS 606.96]
MNKRSKRHPRDFELMDENIVGIYLSEQPLCDTNQTTRDDEPKLRRFVNDQESIQQPRLVGSGIHGVVILAVIKGAEYALKIFKEWKQPGPVFYSYDRAIYVSPLACECRAYARLDSINENGTWAAKCYGWMRLSDAQFNLLGNTIDTCGLSRWVVVKEYISSPTNTSHLQTISENFKIPQAARIYPGDIRPPNYRGSKIVDLSSTLTDPCPEWSEFCFGFFYENLVHGVFDWFNDE